MKGLTSVPYAALVHTLSKIESTTKRLEIASYLTQFLTKVMQTTPGDLLKVVYLCINRLCPDYEGLELGLGESTLLTAISESTGRTEKQIKADYKIVGDLGTVAQVGISMLFQPGLLMCALTSDRIRATNNLSCSNPLL